MAEATNEIGTDPGTFDDEFGAIAEARDAKYADEQTGKGPPLDDLFGATDPATPKETKAEEEPETEDTEGRPTEPQDEFDDELIERAEDVGLNPDDFGSPGALERVVSRLERRERQARAERPADEQPFEWPEIGEVTKLDIAAELGELDETAAALLSKINEHAHTVAEKQQKTLKFLTEHAQRREAQEFQDEFDRLLGAKGEDWQDIYAAGPSSELSPRSKAYRERNELFEELKGRMQRDPGKSMSTHFERAWRTINMDRIREKEKEQTRASLKKRSKKTVSRPSKRAVSTPIDDMPRGEARAKRRLKQKLQEAGLGDYV